MAESQPSSKILVTGGAGFVGSAVVRQLLGETDVRVLNFDKLTYAASLSSLDTCKTDPRYEFVEADICDALAVREALGSFQPEAIVHSAAESHVDRSIAGPAEFIKTNLVGTFTLLDATLDYWKSLDARRQSSFRFLHVSTDEVYGSLGRDGLFTESTTYDPHSPYSASKAGSDHLTMAWHYTYGLPTLVTHCSNNYGPFQFPEKLVPLMILNALEEKPLPIYGTGDNIRDWLHVADHVRALRLALDRGRVGATYNIGGYNERTNLEIVGQICTILDELRPRRSGSYRDLIAFVEDRPGHDKRYAIDAQRITAELDWRPRHSFEEGLADTIRWYLENQWWWKPYRKSV